MTTDERRSFTRRTTGGRGPGRKFWRARMGSSGCAMIARQQAGTKRRFTRRCGISGGQGWNVPLRRPGSGLFKSTDRRSDGKWKSAKECQGLPPKPYGRIAVQGLSSKPKVVYANMRLKREEGMYRSDDGVRPGPSSMPAILPWCGVHFILAIVIVDPKGRKQNLPSQTLIVLLSNDGGKNLQRGFWATRHGDFHDV